MSRKRTSRNGLSLVEVVISAMLVGVPLVGAMKCVGAVIRGRLSTGDSGNADQLASQLASEILQQAYLEPIDPPLFGREAAESSANRSNWDDVDDYHLWSASPPQDRNGAALPSLTGWQRDVVVEWVTASDPSLTVGSDQGAKRVTVTVRRNGQVVAQETALRSNMYTTD